MTLGDESEDAGDGKWHVSRVFPLPLIVSLFLMFVAQTATVAWWASRLDARVDVVEHVQAQMAPQGERLTRLEEKVVSVQAGVGRIEALLTTKSSR